MTPAPLRVLLVENDEPEYWLTRRFLNQIPDKSVTLEWAPTYAKGMEVIQQQTFDVCLVDYHLPDRDGVEFLREVRQKDLNTPIILLTENGDDSLDIEAMRAGASDFLVKGQLAPALLERTIRYTVERRQTQEEHRRVYEELQLSELRFRSVVQSANDGIVLADSNSAIMFWNKGAEQIFGYREDEVMGFSIDLLLAERHRDSHRPGNGRFCLAGRSSIVGKTVELEGLRKDGTDFPLELSLASWTTREGAFFTAIIRDISERRRAEQLRREKEASEHASREKSRFVASISHELRTPLNAVLGFSKLLLQNPRRHLDSSELDFVQRIRANAEEQLHLINGLLDLSKIESGRMDVQLAQADLRQVIDEVIQQFEVRGDLGVSLGMELPDNIALIEADAVKLKQVLTNLVDNALQFTQKGSVTIHVETEPTVGTPVRIDVVDTGSGISYDRLRHIFEPLGQRGGHLSADNGGAGLGLAISKSLCDLMNYHLSVRSQPSLGSTFSIFLSTEHHRLPLSA